jgi:hypothetical protein
MVDLPVEHFAFFLLVCYFMNFTAEAIVHSLVQFAAPNQAVGVILVQVTAAIDLLPLHLRWHVIRLGSLSCSLLRVVFSSA